jgi:signal transduction histidine kinase
MLGHEIKAPLNAVTGLAEIMLLGKTGLPDQYRTYLGDILAGGRHVLDVIDRVLTIVRLELGQYPLQLTRVDLVELTRQCLRALEPEAQVMGLTLTIEAPAPIAGLVDATVMRQVLTNILSNAVKYSSPGGQVKVQLSSADEKIAWRIDDHGSGIAPEDLARILVPFERAVGADRPLLEGLGLGLTIANALVEQLGGRLTLTSCLGQGTQVVIEVPKDVSKSTESGEESRS